MRYIVQEDKGIVVAILEKDIEDIAKELFGQSPSFEEKDNLIMDFSVFLRHREKIKFVGISKCSAEDNFDLKFGKKLAAKRAIFKYWVWKCKQINKIINFSEKIHSHYKKIYRDQIDKSLSASFELISLLNKKEIENEHLPKLTKEERAFCELVKTGWIVRDEDGLLYIYNEKPCKRCDSWISNEAANRVSSTIFSVNFSFIKCNDTEPWSVEDLLKLEVEE